MSHFFEHTAQVHIGKGTTQWIKFSMRVDKDKLNATELAKLTNSPDIFVWNTIKKAAEIKLARRAAMSLTHLACVDIEECHQPLVVQSTVVPPAPRLVGIELNPGPPRNALAALKGGIAQDLASAVGQVAANIARTVKKKKGKKKNKSSAAQLTGSITIQREPMPTSMAPVMRNRAKPVQMELPFDVISVPIYTNASKNVVFGSPTSTFTVLPLDPTSSVTAAEIFGIGVQQIVNRFRRYKLRSLAIGIETAFATSTAGGLAAVYSADGGWDTNAVVATKSVLNSEGSVMSPLWKSFTVPTPGLVTDWCYSQDPTASTGASFRQTTPGVLLIVPADANPSGTLSASSFLGWVHLKGVIDLSDLSVTPAVSTVAKDSSSVSAPPQVIEPTIPAPRIETPSTNGRYVYVDDYPRPPAHHL